MANPMEGWQLQGNVIELDESELAWSAYLALKVCVNHPQTTNWFPIPLCDLDSDDTARSFFTDFLSSMGVTAEDGLLHDLLSFCRLTNAERTRFALTTAIPIVAAVRVLITIPTMEGGEFEFGNETSAVIQAMEESVDDYMALRMVPASQASLDALEKVMVDRSCSMDQCMICLEEFYGDGESDQPVTRMPCSHVYHGNCIIKWLKTNHYCPLCRFEMPT